MTIPLARRGCDDDSAIFINNASPSNSTTNINQSNSVSPVLTGSAGHNAMSNSESVIATDIHWVNKHWRPVMGWSYVTICCFDFLVAPILWSIFQALFHGTITQQWQPVTLQGAGLYHLAMGTIMGITSYGRTREKIAGVHSS